jgi:hypothetical protein
MEIEYDCDKFEFTDFHFRRSGTLDLRVFDQAVWWVDRSGDPHLLAEMSAEYRANVLNWIIRYKGLYFLAIVRRRLIEAALGIELTKVLGFPDAFPNSAEEWLARTALFRELASTRH